MKKSKVKKKPRRVVKKKPIPERLAWHVLPPTWKLGHGDNRSVRVGEWRVKQDGDIRLCAHGLHASQHLLDALGYNWMANPAWKHNIIICRVKCRGPFITGRDKFVGCERKVLWAVAGLPIFEKVTAHEDYKIRRSDNTDTLYRRRSRLFTAEVMKAPRIKPDSQGG